MVIFSPDDQLTSANFRSKRHLHQNNQNFEATWGIEFFWLNILLLVKTVKKLSKNKKVGNPGLFQPEDAENYKHQMRCML